jgi:hypothetical protein
LFQVRREQVADMRIVLIMATSIIDILEKPISRIKQTCVMMGVNQKFDRALPELETYLEGEVANGETSETRLTHNGLCFLKQAFAKSE